MAAAKPTILILLASTMLIWGVAGNRFIGAQETFYLLEPSEDAYVSQYNPGSNYGRDEVVSVRSYRTGMKSFNHRLYLKFNLMQLVPGHQVVSATLRLFKYIEGGQVGTRKIEVRNVLGEWHETSVTWNSRPNLAEKLTGWTYVEKAGNWYEWDVTVGVRSWLNENLANNGFCIIDSEEDSSIDYASVFYSREAYEMYMYRPKLEIKLDTQIAQTISFNINPILPIVFAAAVLVFLVIMLKIRKILRLR